MMRKRIRGLALKVAKAIYDRSNKISSWIEKFHTSNNMAGEREESFAQIIILIISVVLIFPLLILMVILKKQAY